MPEIMRALISGGLSGRPGGEGYGTDYVIKDNCEAMVSRAVIVM